MGLNTIKRGVCSAVMAAILSITLIIASSYTGNVTKADVPDIPFDINADGTASLTDVALLAQYVAEWDVEIVNEDKLDTDLNGSIDLQDVSKTAQHVAGWNLTENYSINYGAFSWPTVAPDELNAGLSYNTPEDAPVATGDLSRFLLSADKNPGLAFNLACWIENDTVTALLPAGTPINAMRVDFAYSGDSITHNGAPVISGETQFDFRKPVELTLNKGDDHKKITVYVMVLNTGLPSMAITTENMVEIDSKVDKKNCSVFAGGGEYQGYRFDENEYVMATGTVKGRGWTSWYYYPKKSYTLKFNKKQSLIGLPAHKEWVLAANFADRTLMRNAIGQELANILEMETVMDVRFVDLWVNGEYVGNYNLIEKIEVDENRVNVTDFDENIAPEDMGYIVETNGHNKAVGEFGVYTNGQDADRPSLWEQLDEKFTYDPISGDIFFSSKHYTSVFNVNKPSDGKLMDIEKSKMMGYLNYIYDYMDKLEAAIKSQSYSEASKYLDMESMAKWYIISELSMNTDSRLHCSCYMYKDGGGKMKMGPMWDFDLGFGNGRYANNTTQHQAYLDYSTWFADLLSMPQFKKMVQNVWDKYSEKIWELPSFITKTANMLNKSQKLNFTIWDITEPGEHCYDYTTTGISDYQGHIDYTRDFTAFRIAYMETKITHEWA